MFYRTGFVLTLHTTILSEKQSYLIFWYFAIYVWFLLFFRFISSKGIFDVFQTFHSNVCINFCCSRRLMSLCPAYYLKC